MPEKGWSRKEGGTTFTFVTDGIESALKQAKTAAGDKNVNIAGGAGTVQQFIRARLLDELEIHLAPLLFGEGIRLFDKMGPEPIELENIRVVASPKVTHLRCREVKGIAAHLRRHEAAKAVSDTFTG